MTSSTQLNNLTVHVNGNQIAYEAETLEWMDGQGEYKVRNACVGGGATEQVFAEDIKTRLGTVKFSMPTTARNLKLVRSYKANLNNNTVEISGRVDGETISKIFTQASVINQPNHKASTDGSIDLEWASNPAV